jgi:hypothetical protein
VQGFKSQFPSIVSVEKDHLQTVSYRTTLLLGGRIYYAVKRRVDFEPMKSEMTSEKPVENVWIYVSRY